jgi:hypothetical protein
MGFTVMSKYAIQNFPKLDAYFEHILTCDDIIDISAYRKKFASIQAFYFKLNELKHNLDVIEFEPNKIINYRKLESGGMSKSDIADFSDRVYEQVDDEKYFSIKQIKSDGFDDDLFDLGFDDWFYSNLLVSDERFSYAMMFGNLIFYKGTKRITIKSFLLDLIRKYVSIDTYDLMNEITDVYGCKVNCRSDVLYKVQGTEIFYDEILDRFYANEDVYYREIDEMDGV